MNCPDIVLIEDNLQDIEMIIFAFMEHNKAYKVYAVNDGAEAIDYFFGPQGCIKEVSAQFPKLILLDLKLPKVNGFEVLERLKSDKRAKQIPVVMFTSSNEHVDRVQCYALGANSYIVKPSDAEVFSRFAADIGSYWLARNRTIYD
jgi:two-component system response regulator